MSGAEEVLAAEVEVDIDIDMPRPPARRIKLRLDGARYDKLARMLLDGPDPVTAIAHLLGDHEGRLDAMSQQRDELRGQLDHLRHRVDKLEG